MDERESWFPSTQNMLALAILVIIATIVMILMLRPPQLNEMTYGVLATLIGILTGCLKEVYSYFFGSSQGSANKDMQQARVAEKLAEKVTGTGSGDALAAAALVAPAAAAAAAPPAAVVAAPPAAEAAAPAAAREAVADAIDDLQPRKDT